MTLRPGGSNSVERNQRDSKSQDPSSRESSSGPGLAAKEFSQSNFDQSSTMQGSDMGTREIDVARRVIGTWSENITVVHELFRRAFSSFHQPASRCRDAEILILQKRKQVDRGRNDLHKMQHLQSICYP